MKINLPERPERVSLDDELQYAGESAGWSGLRQYKERQIALRIGGDELSPSDDYVKLAEIVLPKLAEIERASNEYLRAFVGDGGGFYQGNWRIRSLRVRLFDARFQKNAGNKFEITLAVGETITANGASVSFTTPFPHISSNRILSRGGNGKSRTEIKGQKAKDEPIN